MTKGSDLQVAALENREVACISPFWERSIPEGVDTDKIEAAFKNGVLNVTLPKKPEAQKPAKNIEVKAA